jgi:hypothetical protein
MSLFLERNRYFANLQYKPVVALCDNAPAPTGTPAVAVSPIAPIQKTRNSRRADVH